MSRAATSRLKVNAPLGNMPVLQFVRPGEIRVDPAYQRSLDVGSSQSLIRRMAQFWNWDLCQPLVLARRMAPEARLFVIDGQHRLAAASLRGDIDQLPCVIVNYASPADEAASFVHLNQQRRPLTRLDLFKAAVASEDPESLALVKAMKVAGLSVAPHSNFISWKPGMVQNVGGLQKAWRANGPTIAAQAMTVLAKAYPEEPLRYAGSIFPGIVSLIVDPARALTTTAVMALFIGETSQVEWYKAIGAACSVHPNRETAARALFRERWAEWAPPIPPRLL